MKKIFFLLSVLFLLPILTFAQAPQGINYQGVARNSQGAAMGMQTISVQITIMHNGTPVYQEHQTVQTDTFGLYSLVIGASSAVVTQGSFTSIPWSAGNQSVQIDIDPSGGSSYTPVSTMALQSVPYALYAASAGGSSNGTVTSITAGAGLTATPNPITSSGTLDLPVFPLVAGPWGSATSIPTFTVDAYGRIVAISSTPIATSSTSIAVNGGGITSASNVNAYTLTVNNSSPIWNANSLMSTPLTLTTLNNGDVLRYSGSSWINSPIATLPPGTGGEMLFNLGGTWTASNPNNLTFTPGNFMGIGNSTPGAFLHVTSPNSSPAIIADNAIGSGPAIVSNGLLRVNGPLQMLNELRDAVNLSGNNGDILISQGSGTAPKWQPASSILGSQPWTLSGNNLYATSGNYNVGIGTAFPNGNLGIVNANGSTSPVLDITNNGSGYGINITNNFSGGGSSMLKIFHQDVSPAVYVTGQNASNTADIMYVETHGAGNAIKGYSDQGGAAIIGYSHGSSSGSAGIYGLQDNLGSAGVFGIYNASSSDAVIKSSTTGSGYTGVFSGGAGLQTDKIQITGAPASGYVLTSDGSGNGTWQAPAGGLPAGLNGQVMYNDGSGWVGTSLTSMSFNGTQLGIGTNTPSAYLEVQSPSQAANFVSSGNITPAVNIQSSGGATALNVSNLNGGSAAVFQNNASGTSPVITVNNSGTGRSATFNGGSGVQVDNIFVGNNLNVALNANPGWILTSNAVGDATWQPPAVPLGTFKQMLFNNGGAWIPTAVNNLAFDGSNMGIGNPNPSTLLDINSNNAAGAVNVVHGSSSSAVTINATASANSTPALKVSTAGAGFSGKFTGGTGLSTDKIQINNGAGPDAVLLSTNTNGDAVWAVPVNFSIDGGTTTSTSGSAVTVGFTNVNYCSPAGAVSAGTYTVPVNGLYHFDGAAAFNVTTGLSAPTDFVLRILINGGIYRETIVHLPTGYTGVVQNTISVDASLATGQTVRLAFLQSSGQSINTIGGASENYFNGHIVR